LLTLSADKIKQPPVVLTQKTRTYKRNKYFQVEQHTFQLQSFPVNLKFMTERRLKALRFKKQNSRPAFHSHLATAVQRYSMQWHWDAWFHSNKFQKSLEISWDD